MLNEHKPVVIFGAAGALGQQLVRVFSDMPVIVWKREDGDITNTEKITQRLRELQPGLIINAAAYNDVDGAEEHRDIAMAVNATAVETLAHAAKELGADFVTYSTDYVFEGTNAMGYREDDTPKPIDVYGESKLAGERAALMSGARVWVIRVSRLFGPPGTSASAKENFPDKMIKLAGTKPRLEVINDVVSTPTYTVDVACATRTLLEDDAEQGVYHLINEGTGSWYDIACEALRIKGISTEVVPVPSTAFVFKAKRPTHSTLLNTKRPKLRTWQEALAEYLLGKSEARNPKSETNPKFQ